MCMGLCEALTVGRLGKLRECSNGMSDRVCVRVKVRACYKKTLGAKSCICIVPTKIA